VRFTAMVMVALFNYPERPQAPSVANTPFQLEGRSHPCCCLFTVNETPCDIHIYSIDHLSIATGTSFMVLTALTAPRLRLPTGLQRLRPMPGQGSWTNGFWVRVVVHYGYYHYYDLPHILPLLITSSLPFHFLVCVKLPSSLSLSPSLPHVTSSSANN